MTQRNGPAWGPPLASRSACDTDHANAWGGRRVLETEIVELLSDGVARTASEVAERGRGGIGARRAEVKACLLDNAGRFEAVNGREEGRSGKAVLYRLRDGATRGAVSAETRSTSSGPRRRAAGRRTSKGTSGQIEYPLAEERVSAVELRVPTNVPITLLIGGDERWRRE
jgi:hypothetical protein